MIKSPHLNRIVIIVMLVIAIAVLLYLLSSNYLFDRDLQTNIELIQTVQITQEPSFNDDDDRVYHIIYDKNDEYSVYAKENIERIIKILKVKYTVSEINAEVKNITNKDILLLTAKKWINYTAEIDNILENVADGAGLLISLFPGHDSYFVTLQQKFGLYSLGEQRIASSINIENDILMGLKKGETIEADVAVDLVYEIFTTSDTKIYITDEKEIPMYYTIEYGRGKIGVYNGENILDRAFEGTVVGMLGTLGKEFLYPIIDSGVLFMDDWPAPFIFKDENIYEQYGMDYNDFLEYIWWPDIVSMLEKYDIELSSALLIDYNDLVEPPFDSEYEVLSSEMYVH